LGPELSVAQTLDVDPFLAVDPLLARWPYLIKKVLSATSFARRSSVDANRPLDGGRPATGARSNRFDHTHAVTFKHFPLTTIDGELKWHFRDKGWTLRVSRLAEPDPRLATVVSLRFLDELTQSEIGDKIGCSQAQVSRLRDRA
jgi:Sigma-70, region 4